MGLGDDVLSRLILSDDAQVVFKGRREKGSHGQEEIYSYDVFDASGASIGSVIYTEHVSLNGFRRSYRVVQKDENGKVLVDTWW